MNNHDNLSRSECSFTDTSISTITSDVVSNPPTKVVREKQKSEMWEDIECPLCHESVEKICIRRHQEHDCPERLEFCPQCYSRVPQSQLQKHRKICTAPLKTSQSPKEKVEPTKVLSFTGTVFDKHVKIAKSFINIARGHQDVKAPYTLVMKAEMKAISQQTPPLDVLVNKFSPAIYLRSNREFAKSCQNINGKKQTQGSLSSGEAQQQVSANSSATNFEKKKSNTVKDEYKPIQAPEKAIRLRQVHRSLADLRREECSRRKFTKSWLERWRRSKERKREGKIQDEEESEDRIIDEAIELEMNKDTVSLIPKEKWPNFVQDIKKRRSKWKDLGLDHEDIRFLRGDEDEGDNEEIETFPEKNSNNKNKITEFHESLENFFGVDAENKQQGEIPESSPDFHYFNQVNSKLSKQSTTQDISNGGGFYKPCESCYQLFHENHLHQHTVYCKTKKERAVRNKQRIKETWNSRKTLNDYDIRRIVTSPALTIPRPFITSGDNESSLAASLTPHSKNTRAGNYYAFMTKIGHV